jgi:hypothetical protein
MTVLSIFFIAWYGLPLNPDGPERLGRIHPAPVAFENNGLPIRACHRGGWTLTGFRERNEDQ